MPRKKTQVEALDESQDEAGCGKGGCAGSCQPRAVPVEDVVVGVVRLVKDGFGTVGGLGAAVAPGLKLGLADLTGAARQGLKRLSGLAASLGAKKPAVAAVDETQSA